MTFKGNNNSFKVHKNYFCNGTQFLVAITKDNDFFIARCPEINVTSHGETLADVEIILKQYRTVY
jgi:hypothetical protein